MIKYNTNWMGPVRIDWYKKRGLTKQVTTTLTDMSLSVQRGTHKAGDVVTYDDITETWAGGRIDVYGTDNPYGEEIGLPIMHGKDYRRFSNWLDTVETTEIWTLKQLVEQYELTNPKIRWDKEEFNL